MLPKGVVFRPISSLARFAPPVRAMEKLLAQAGYNQYKQVAVAE